LRSRPSGTPTMFNAIADAPQAVYIVGYSGEFMRFNGL
jgi:hypothetical protein